MSCFSLLSTAAWNCSPVGFSFMLLQHWICFRAEVIQSVWEQGQSELPSHLCSEFSRPEQRFPEGIAEQMFLKQGKTIVADGFYFAK